MKKSVIYTVWAVLYCICVGLGFTKDPEGLGKFLLTASSVIFFLPPFYLAWQARNEKNRKTMLVLRLVSIAVLSLSLILIALNFLSVYFSAQTGLVLYVLLVMFTAPMVCSQYWALSLFLWACVLMLSLQKIKPESSPAQR